MNRVAGSEAETEVPRDDARPIDQPETEEPASPTGDERADTGEPDESDAGHLAPAERRRRRDRHHGERRAGQGATGHRRRANRRSSNTPPSTATTTPLAAV